MGQADMNLHGALKDAGIDLIHHFSAGVYIKQTAIPAGKELMQHKHEHDHLAVLCKGWARITEDGTSRDIRGPVVLTIEAGKHHAVKALTDIHWLCVWATHETDADSVDATLIEKEKE